MVRALLLLPLLAGCPETVCTLIGCDDGLTLHFDKATPWQAGTWTLSLDLDGAEVTCTATLPFAAEDFGQCDDGQVWLMTSGSALPDDQHAIEGVMIQEAFERVEVALAHEGTVEAEAVLEPVYQTVQPNGPDCPPTCHQASDTLTVP